MPEQFRFIVWGIGIAFAIALVLASVAALWGRSGNQKTGPRWGVALGIGIGYMVGHGIVREWHAAGRPHEAWLALRTWSREGGSFPLFPLESHDWLVWIVGGATVLGLLDGTWPAPRWARWQNRILFCSLMIWLLLSSQVGSLWEPLQATKWMLGLGVGTFALWTFLDVRAERLGPSMPLVLLILLVGLCVAQIASGSLIYCGLSAALAATIGAVWVVSWFSSRLNLARAGIPVFSLAYAGLIIVGIFYSELPRASALAFALAPLASLIDRVGFVARLGRPNDDSQPTPQGWKIALCRVVAVVVPVAIAAGWAVINMPKEAAATS